MDGYITAGLSPINLIMNLYCHRREFHEPFLSQVLNNGLDLREKEISVSSVTICSNH
jgi:hypothetical protein